jgi:ATP-binding protein involved in chromosome partitioning
LLGQIPLSTAVREAGDSGVPVVVGSPDSPQAASFLGAAEGVEAELKALAKKGSGLPILDMSDNRGDAFTV